MKSKYITALLLLLSLQLAAQEASPGLVLKIFSLGVVDLKEIPEMEANQTPSATKIVPAVIFADYLDNLNAYSDFTSYWEFSGIIDIPETKSYSFRLRNIDGAKLYIDGNLIIDNDKVSKITEKDGEMYLQKGKHTVKVAYLKTPPGTRSVYREITLWWYNEEKTVFEYIPASYFSHTEDVKVGYTKEFKKYKGQQVFDFIAGDGFALRDIHPSYDLIKIRPAAFQPRVAAMDFYPNGNMVLTTWDSAGGVYLIKNLHTNDTNQIEIKRIAAGVAEPLGVKVVNGKLYVLQKQELTELVDTDGDEIIDEYRTVCNGWGVTANFHEFAFGLVYKEGFLYAALAIAIQPGGNSTIPQNPDRGKVIKINPEDGSFEFIAKGLRTPNGIGIGVDDEIFITDNQGQWLPSCKVLHLKPGAFYNNYSVDINMEGKWEVTPPVVWLPQNEIGNSPGNPTYLNDGPYKGQMIHGEVTHGGIKRVFVEKIKGEYQGAVFRHSQGLEAGVNRIAWGPDSALYIGGIGVSGNWGQTGKLHYGFQKIKYNGKTAFEMLAVRAKTNGMEIELTEPLQKGYEDSLLFVSLETWRYVPNIRYGGPKVDGEDITPTSYTVSPDRKKIFIEMEGLKEGWVVYIRLNNSLLSESGQKLWSTEAWYTLNNIPENDLGPIKRKPEPKVTKTTGAKPASTAVKPAAPAKPAVSEEQLLAEGKKLIPYTGCTNCHAYDSKILGPSFNDVAAKYPNDAKSFNYLVKKVTEGGSGVWGEHAMSPQSHIKKADIEKMVKYILSIDGK